MIPPSSSAAQAVVAVYVHSYSFFRSQVFPQPPGAHDQQMLFVVQNRLDLLYRRVLNSLSEGDVVKVSLINLFIQPHDIVRKLWTIKVLNLETSFNFL